MQIEQQKNKKFENYIFGLLFNKRLIYIFFIAIFFMAGVLVHRSGIFYRIRPVLSLRFRLVENYIKGLRTTKEHIYIDIKHMNFQRLAYKREIALSMNKLILTEDDYVPATIRYKNERLRAKIRLKGDFTEHLEGDKWSFRIAIKGEQSLFGMKQFSIHHPKRRNYLHEWFFHKALNREGVISLRYNFIDVTLNGKHLGLYAVEEHFEKRLIENNRRREGPIIRFNESLFWDQDVQFAGALRDRHRSGYGYYLSSDIDAFKTNQILSDSMAFAQFVNAAGMLESFRENKLKSSDVFDIPLMAKYMALTDVMGAQHSAGWQNLRFYYNPVTALLEPIGFDGDSGQNITYLNAIQYSVFLNNTIKKPPYLFFTNLFSDEVLFREYIKNLERMSRAQYLDSLFAAVSNEFEENLHILYSEFQQYYFNKSVLYDNQKYIRAILEPKKGCHAYFDGLKNDAIRLEIGNIQAMPVKILNVSFKDSTYFYPHGETILPAKIYGELIDYFEFAFDFPKGFVFSDTMKHYLSVHYQILGHSKIRNETVFGWRRLQKDLKFHDFIKNSNFRGQKFLYVNDESRKIYFKSGAWQIHESLVIPAGYRVIAGPGLKLELVNGTGIISYSPITFIGDSENPISIVSTDSTGQGLTVINATEQSDLEFVHFENLTNPDKGSWKLTAAVTFYDSPVRIEHCQFFNNHCEDYLNIIRTDFEMNDVTFKGVYSDAFDGDFTNGMITGCRFVNCGNDACDISGSEVTFENLTVDGAGDKGISVGESSNMTGRNIRIQNSEIALASKDMSTLHLDGANLSDCKVGFAVYQKKAEFGSASIVANNVSMSRVRVPHLIEDISALVLNGQQVVPDAENVREMLYGVQYGK